MSINIQERIRRLREDSPLLGRNARHYIADVLEGLFKSQVAHYGTSSTEADVVEKHVLSPAPGFDVPGRSTKLAVHFTHGNTAINPTLRVGATQPAYPISKVSNWAAGTTVEFVFDGETWRMLGAKKATVTHPLMDMATGHVGTDNGEFANADHVHPVHIYHDTSHVVSGRFVLDRMPTSEVANRVLAVGTAETTPEFQQVNDQMIANNAVVTRTIMDQNVTEPKLADNAVITRTIMDQNVTTPKLADLAVTEAKLADNAVVTRTIMDQNVTESKLADDAVVTRTILDQNVTESKLADNAVVTRTIMDQNVTEPKLADNAVVTRTIMDRNVTEPKLADDAVVTRTILDQNVTESKLADNAVVTRTIMDQNVTEPKLADNAVVTRTIMDRNVTEPKLADNAVVTRTIMDQNVTEPKLADEAVVTRTIMDRNVTTSKMAHRAVTGNELFTSSEANVVLRVGEAGTDPAFGKVNMATDFEGILPVERGGTGAENPTDARYHLNALSNISPITGGEMRRIVITDFSFTINETSGSIGVQVAHISGHIEGTSYTDGYFVSPRAFAAITHLDWGGTNLHAQVRTLAGQWSGSGTPTHVSLIQHLPPITS